MSATVCVASDHRGFPFKAQVLAWLENNGYLPRDLGTHSDERCDAFDFATRLAGELRAHSEQKGILICGSGQAMAMTANRYQHIRAALCSETASARLSREHNDANVLVLGADIVTPERALECIETFLGTQFLGGRYAERRDRLTQLGGL
ncbi:MULTISPECIES: RpiB/LacA/LacB family sugar-phosphate isomerase [Asticcacaulis]|uniref:RpiB/LacA/LacB family sugar-phosphate isomerase n=1 Tax=Asticcacaulis TaxID=76890 RepID=UPI001AE96F2C|nr:MULTISPECIES: RpiB/LacA/LacB family sugar-phosphate isomerase [Asticcacaulis]MBP2158932.1 ribose 5-phosphate isomerase B [Asticcacaulis solisilvae]MDR6799977.1 ribose 5-phosphate isomerase B [Asticcacaulis sp. BE141]